MTESQAPAGSPALRPRPVAPHLQVWRWHVTMAGSILHRASGVSNYLGALVLVGWLLALAGGPAAYGAYMSALGSPLGKLVLFGFTVGVFYHLANGVRHLVWDFGRGLQPQVADFTAVVVMSFAVAASLAVFGVALFVGAV